MISKNKKAFFENKFTEFIIISHHQQLTALNKSLELPSKVSSCEFKACKMNITGEHDLNLVLEGIKKLLLNFGGKSCKIAAQTTQ